MFGGFIKKTIYLPSGGASYPPLAYVGKPDSAYAVMRLDPNGSDSPFDVEMSTIRHYCDLPAPIEEMYTQDLHYIWAYMMTMDMAKSDTLKLVIGCPKCGHANSAFVSMSSMDVCVLNAYADRLETAAEYSAHGITFVYGPRRCSHNAAFGALVSQLEDSSGDGPGLADVLSTYCATQLGGASCDGAALERHDWLHAVRSLTTAELVDMFVGMRALTKSFGIYDMFSYSCKKCSTRGEAWVYDDIAMSHVTPSTVKGAIGRLESVFKGAIEESRLPSFTMDDVLSRPLRYGENFGAALREIKFNHGMVIS